MKSTLRLITFSLITASCISLTGPAVAGKGGASPGSLDPTFGVGGIAAASFGTDVAEAEDVAIQPDGKILMVGSLMLGLVGPGTYSSADFALARFNPDGSLDTTFGQAGKVVTDIAGARDIAVAVTVLADGKILVAGHTLVSVPNQRSSYDLALVRYNANGTLDSSFGKSGKVVTDLGGGVDYIKEMVLQPDGKILLAARLDAPQGQPSNYSFGLVRLYSDGSIDTTFGNQGIVRTSFTNFSAIYTPSALSRDIALQPDGKIVLAGDVGYSATTQHDFALTRYHTDGSLDQSFGSGGLVVTDFAGGYDSARAVMIQSDGKIVAVGVVGNGDFGLARYNTNGGLDPAFGVDGRVTTDMNAAYVGSDIARAVVIQPDNKIIVAGETTVVTATRKGYTSALDFGLVRYATNGTTDAQFGSQGKVTTNVGGTDDSASGVAIQTDGKIVVSGDGGGRFVAVRYVP